MEPFAPFVADAEEHPALYLGFDRPLPNRNITLYWNVAPTAHDDTVVKQPDLTWQYSATDRWNQLHLVGDETHNGAIGVGWLLLSGPLIFNNAANFAKNSTGYALCAKAAYRRFSPSVSHTDQHWLGQPGDYHPERRF